MQNEKVVPFAGSSLEQEMPKRRRIIVKKGMQWILINLDDIVYCYSFKKTIFIVDREGKKYMSDKSLSRLESELDPALFFKANRNFLISFHYIKGFLYFEKSKLKVEMNTTDKHQFVIISQSSIGNFKKWIYQQL